MSAAVSSASQSQSNAEYITKCKHFKYNAEVRDRLHRIASYAAKAHPPCASCKVQSRTTFCCLHCYFIGCGRRENKCALGHAKKDNHPLCVNMQHPNNLWCYSCDTDVVLMDDNLNSETSENEYEEDDIETSSNSSSAYNNSRVVKRTRNSVKQPSEPLFPPPEEWSTAAEILEPHFVWHNNNNTVGNWGMANLGNTCFMNSSLQALIHIPSFVYLFTLPEMMEVCRRHRIPLVDDLIALTKTIWTHTSSRDTPVLSPRNILRDLMYLYPQFRGYGQHDAHEFLRCLLDHLHEMFKYSVPIYETESPLKNKKKALPSPNSQPQANGVKEKEEKSDDTSTDDKSGPNAKQSEKKREPKERKTTSVVEDLFGGEMISEVECTVCGRRSVTRDVIYDISVEIPKTEQIDKTVEERDTAQPLKKQSWGSWLFTSLGLTQQPIPLDLCLHSYCTSEDLQHTEKYHCDRCKKKVDAKKRLALSKLPEILMIHIKRFSHNSFWNGSSKVTTPVTFPMNAFDLETYIHRDHKNTYYNKDTLYDLCSLVKHMGGTGGGHYIAYAKHPGTAAWYRFDDTRIERTSPDHVKDQQAYVLFYARRRTQRNNIPAIQKALSLSASNMNKSPNNHDSNYNVQLSRYWLHRVVACSRPGPIHNLWLSCYHGFPLKPSHKRRKYCSVSVSKQTWDELVQRFGQQYTNESLFIDNNALPPPASTTASATSTTTTPAAADNTSTKGGDKKEETAAEEADRPQPWNLDVESPECSDCVAEVLVRRRQYEKNEIKRLEEECRVQDCALAMEWANRWRDFVHGRSDESPGTLDNNPIHGGDHNIKPNLVYNQDYLLVPTPIWTFLIELYGGGPKIIHIPPPQPKPKAQPRTRQSASPPTNPAPPRPRQQPQQKQSQSSPKQPTTQPNHAGKSPQHTSTKQRSSRRSPNQGSTSSPKRQRITPEKPSINSKSHKNRAREVAPNGNKKDDTQVVTENGVSTRRHKHKTPSKKVVNNVDKPVANSDGDVEMNNTANHS